MDPLAALGHDLLVQIMSFLEPEMLCSCQLVCKAWMPVAVEPKLWRQQCQILWADKIYIADKVLRSKSWKQAYVTSIADSTRCHITEDELCSFPWTFRFKSTAGTYWTHCDPSWNKSGAPMYRFFHHDGSITPNDGDPYWGNHESRWAFRTSRLGRTGPYVQVNHWPSMEISRTSNWGWEMQNLWVVYQADLPLVSMPKSLSEIIMLEDHVATEKELPGNEQTSHRANSALATNTMQASAFWARILATCALKHEVSTYGNGNPPL